MEKVFSISHAAEYLGVFPLTLRNWEKKGLIKTYRTPGGHRRYRKKELDKIMGVMADEDRLKDSIERLQEVGFRNGRQEKINRIISDLKSMSEEPEADKGRWTIDERR